MRLQAPIPQLTDAILHRQLVYQTAEAEAKSTSYMASPSTEPLFRFMPMPRKQTMQHEKSASKKAHGEPRSSRKAEKPKSRKAKHGREDT